MSAIIRLTCQACRQEVAVESDAPERVFDCPSCSNPLRIPDADELREMDERARHQAQQQQLTLGLALGRGRRLALWVGCLIIGVNVLLALLINTLPTASPAATKSTNATDAAMDRISATLDRYEYSQDCMRHTAFSAGLALAGAVLLVLLIAARSKTARILFGLLSLIVPIIATLIYLKRSVLSHHLDPTATKVLEGAGILRLVVSIGGAVVLLTSARLIAYTARPARTPNRPVQRVA